MRSDEILIHFPPMKFERGLTFLKGLSGTLSSIVRQFSELNEEQMIIYKYPPFVSTIQKYRNALPRLAFDHDEIMKDAIRLFKS